MKKIFTLLLCSVLCTNYSFGQYESRKGYAGIAMGSSRPLASYSSTDILKDESGFAKNGFALNFNFAYRLGSNYGVTAMLLTQVNSFDNNAFLSGFKKYVSPSSTITGSLSVDSDPWMINAIKGGIFGSIPLESRGKLILEPRAFLAIVTAVSPRIRITARNGMSTSYIEQQAGAGAAIGYSLGGLIRYNLSDRLALTLNADYLKAKPKFIDVEFQYSNAQYSRVDFEQKIDALNITLGFAIRFKKDVPPMMRR